MDWNLLKNKNYFNPYKEYNQYECVTTECYYDLPKTIEYEKVIISHDIKLGKMHIIFEQTRFIIGLDIIFYILSLEANLATPRDRFSLFK